MTLDLSWLSLGIKADIKPQWFNCKYDTAVETDIERIHQSYLLYDLGGGSLTEDVRVPQSIVRRKEEMLDDKFGDGGARWTLGHWRSILGCVWNQHIQVDRGHCY